MPDLRQIAKPDRDISDYEWNITPAAVKIVIDRWEQIMQNKQTQIDNLQLENDWLREQLDLKIVKTSQVVPPLIPEILLWAMVGLILTIGGTFIEAATIFGNWFNGDGEVLIQGLGVSYQIGGVLLTGCLGGRNAALIAQIAYLTLGLLGLPIFDRGGGWEYLSEPNFGYLLGFVAGAWVCGYLAFKKLATINNLMLSCCAGLLTIHLIGILYFSILYYTNDLTTKITSFSQGIYAYSIAPLPGQLAVVCATCAIAFALRKLMFS